MFSDTFLAGAAQPGRSGSISVKTQSEKWFEKFCANVGLVCHRISEEDDKTPDYQLQIDGQSIIVEVKEFSRNKVEQRSDRLLEERGYGEALSNTPGDRVRKKIADSSAQIKAKKKEFIQAFWCYVTSSTVVVKLWGTPIPITLG